MRCDDPRVAKGIADGRERGRGRAPRLRSRAVRADANPDLVATARAFRRLLPGDEGYGDPASTSGDQMRDRLRRLKQVGAAEESAVSDGGGIVVKRLGDGTMAVFSHPEQAVNAAHSAQGRLAVIEVEGHSPQLRAGVHLGRPRKVGKDYLGVDVNVAARVGDAAKGGEVLISESVREGLDRSAFSFGRRRRLGATGAPEELVVCPVRPRG